MKSLLNCPSCGKEQSKLLTSGIKYKCGSEYHNPGQQTAKFVDNCIGKLIEILLVIICLVGVPVLYYLINWLL